MPVSHPRGVRGNGLLLSQALVAWLGSGCACSITSICVQRAQQARLGLDRRRLALCYEGHMIIMCI